MLHCNICGEMATYSSKTCKQHWPKPRQFQIVDSTIGFCVLLKELDIPFFNDYAGTGAYGRELDFTNPEEWAETFKGWLVWCIEEQRYEILNQFHHIDLNENGTLLDGDTWIVFDRVTGRMRNMVGFMRLAGIKNSIGEPGLPPTT